MILESLDDWTRAYPGAGTDTPLGPPGARVVLPLLAGDKVLCQMTPYDLSKGRLTYRFR